jgi:hypothetical protein
MIKHYTTKMYRGVDTQIHIFSRLILLKYRMWGKDCNLETIESKYIQAQ